MGLAVHLARDGGRRFVNELSRVERYDHATDRFVLAPMEAHAS